MLRTSAIAMPTDARRAWDFSRRLLCRPAAEQPDVAALLSELAFAFEAQAAGLAMLPDCGRSFRHGGPAAGTWPWEDDPALLAAAARPPGASAVCRLGRPTLLFAPLSGPASHWVLYVEDDREFGDEESAALSLAGHAVGRWLRLDSPPRWADQIDRAARQARLESAAAVTRRLAHDFGNVLTGILGFTELALGQQIPPNTALSNYLDEVYRAAQAGAQFTHQLRLFSRRQAATSRSSSVAQTLAEQEAKMAAAREAGVTFRLDVPADLPPVAMDSECLGQVLGALLANAREALIGAGAVIVTVRALEAGPADAGELYGDLRPGFHVEVTVADTGVGLSPEVQRKLLYEPFFTTKPRRRGFGLATAYGILHAHRGGLRLYPGVEGGVVARVLLPAAGPSRALSEQAARPADRAGERILLADDAPDVRHLIGVTLERAGFRVEAHSDGQSALESYFAAGNDPFRLVVTDAVMPGLDGYQLARRLLERDPTARVLFVSAQEPGGSTAQEIAGHDFELLGKPFRPEQLLRAVRAAMDRAPGRKG